MTDEGARTLAAAIVRQAVKDWKFCCRHIRRYGHLIPQLREFFESEWCSELLSPLDLDPSRLLSVLEEALPKTKRREAQ